MAQKRNCDHKLWKSAKGSSITFIGVVQKKKYEALLNAIQWDIWREVKGNDLIIYLPDDWWFDELNALRENHWDYLMGILDEDNLKVKKYNVVLSKHLPEYLPKFKCTPEEWYARYLESSERDEEGNVISSRTHHGESDIDEPADVKVYSINQYKTNGVF